MSDQGSRSNPQTPISQPLADTVAPSRKKGNRKVRPSFEVETPPSHQSGADPRAGDVAPALAGSSKKVSSPAPHSIRPPSSIPLKKRIDYLSPRTHSSSTEHQAKTAALPAELQTLILYRSTSMELPVVSSQSSTDYRPRTEPSPRLLRDPTIPPTTTYSSSIDYRSDTIAASTLFAEPRADSLLSYCSSSDTRSDIFAHPTQPGRDYLSSRRYSSSSDYRPFRMSSRDQSMDYSSSRRYSSGSDYRSSAMAPRTLSRDYLSSTRQPSSSEYRSRPASPSREPSTDYLPPRTYYSSGDTRSNTMQPATSRESTTDCEWSTGYRSNTTASTEVLLSLRGYRSDRKAQRAISQSTRLNYLTQFLNRKRASRPSATVKTSTSRQNMPRVSHRMWSPARSTTSRGDHSLAPRPTRPETHFEGSTASPIATKHSSRSVRPPPPPSVASTRQSSLLKTKSGVSVPLLYSPLTLPTLSKESSEGTNPGLVNPWHSRPLGLLSKEMSAFWNNLSSKSWLEMIGSTVSQRNVSTQTASVVSNLSMNTSSVATAEGNIATTPSTSNLEPSSAELKRSPIKIHSVASAKTNISPVPSASNLEASSADCKLPSVKSHSMATGEGKISPCPSTSKLEPSSADQKQLRHLQAPRGLRGVRKLPRVEKPPPTFKEPTRESNFWTPAPLLFSNTSGTLLAASPPRSELAKSSTVFKTPLPPSPKKRATISPKKSPKIVPKPATCAPQEDSSLTVAAPSSTTGSTKAATAGSITTGAGDTSSTLTTLSHTEAVVTLSDVMRSVATGTKVKKLAPLPTILSSLSKTDPSAAFYWTPPPYLCVENYDITDVVDLSSRSSRSPPTLPDTPVVIDLSPGSRRKQHLEGPRNTGAPPSPMETMFSQRTMPVTGPSVVRSLLLSLQPPVAITATTAMSTGDSGTRPYLWCPTSVTPSAPLTTIAPSGPPKRPRTDVIPQRPPLFAVSADVPKAEVTTTNESVSNSNHPPITTTSSAFSRFVPFLGNRRISRPLPKIGSSKAIKRLRFDSSCNFSSESQVLPENMPSAGVTSSLSQPVRAISPVTLSTVSEIRQFATDPAIASTVPSTLAVTVSWSVQSPTQSSGIFTLSVSTAYSAMPFPTTLTTSFKQSDYIETATCDPNSLPKVPASSVQETQNPGRNIPLEVADPSGSTSTAAKDKRSAEIQPSSEAVTSPTGSTGSSTLTAPSPGPDYTYEFDPEGFFPYLKRLDSFAKTATIPWATASTSVQGASSINLAQLLSDPSAATAREVMSEPPSSNWPVSIPVTVASITFVPIETTAGYSIPESATATIDASTTEKLVAEFLSCMSYLETATIQAIPEAVPPSGHPPQATNIAPPQPSVSGRSNRPPTTTQAQVAHVTLQDMIQRLYWLLFRQELQLVQLQEQHEEHQQICLLQRRLFEHMREHLKLLLQAQQRERKQ